MSEVKPSLIAAQRFWDAAAQDNSARWVATGFRRLDDAYRQHGVDEARLLLNEFDIKVNKPVIVEIGCGNARLTRYLASVASELIAIDVSPRMIEIAQQELGRGGNVKWVVAGDGQIPATTGSVDLVFSYITMQHIPQLEIIRRYFEEAGRVLTPGGNLLVQIRATHLRAKVLDILAQVGRAALQRRDTMSPYWRGCRPAYGWILQTVGSAGLDCTVVERGRRHAWVFGAKRTSIA